MIQTARLVLSAPVTEDAPAFADYLFRNADFHAPWTPTPPEGFFTTPYWVERFEFFDAEARAGMSVRFLLRLDGAIVGAANFTQIFRGSFLGATLGYGLDAAHEGKGLMFEALSAVIPVMFDEGGLHRIMANHLPENLRSARLLRRLGFVPEGYARDYLRIAGRWRDHVLTALTNPQPDAASG